MIYCDIIGLNWYKRHHINRYIKNSGLSAEMKMKFIDLKLVLN
jgi:hypothetical protein